ncbi:hypothetical protein [Trichothermofontia sp.]
MSVISVTRLRLRSLKYLPSFLWYSLLCVIQAKYTPGNLGIGLLVDANQTFWSRSAWRDESSMRAFVTASFHRSAIIKLSEWADEASGAHWEQRYSTFPTWSEVYQKVREEGYRVPLRHPSPAHIAAEITPPTVLISLFS